MDACGSSNAHSDITPTEFAFLARCAGLNLTEVQTMEFREAYLLLQAMTSLMRGSRDRAAEPAHVFAFGRGLDR
jgi:hypothetical protein